LSYLKTFLSWCVDEELVDTNVAETIKKPSSENERDRYHSLPELAEIWAASGKLEYPFGPLIRLLITLPMRREEVAAMKVAELALGDDKRPQDAEMFAALPLYRPSGTVLLPTLTRNPLTSVSATSYCGALEAGFRLSNHRGVNSTRSMGRKFA
jgi:hypothetical protein